MFDNDFRIPALQLQTSFDVEEECVTVRRSIPEVLSTYLSRVSLVTTRLALGSSWELNYQIATPSLES